MSRTEEFGDEHFKSQYGQDRYVWNKFFRDGKKRFFFEAGIVGGVDISNTWFFENSLGWDGLLVDCSPTYVQRARRVRRAKVVECALADVAETQLLFLDANYLGGLLRYMPENQIKQIEHSSAARSPRPDFKLHWVTANRLDNLLLSEGIEVIDFLSLDVEGAEPQILSTLDFKKVCVNVIAVEAKGPNREKILSLASANGFVLDTILHDSDLILVNSNFMSKL